MKSKIMNLLKYLMFILIPVLSVSICVLFRLAQGEKTEEIAFGIMVGILLDIIYSFILLWMTRKSASNKND